MDKFVKGSVVAVIVLLLAKMNVPQIIVTGGEKGINPLDMVGVNQALEIQKKLK